MKAAEIRATFLSFFASKGHTVVPSSPVIPGDDPTLLFTNAGMNQFKDVFLGYDKRPYLRAATAQKCIRAGGKHNDLENVGYTARHHTFFEMLGNFSFGDYFKRDALVYAWELLTEVYKLPKDKLWATVYADDDEAYVIWTDVIGLPADRIVRIGDKGARYASDNFWMMGDTGPCGPCSEIFYDHGPQVAGGPPGSADEDGDRYIEIWNNVFMQWNRDEAGVMHPLPKPSVDTGMGLERLTAVLQGVHSNYEIDLFVNLLAASRRAVEAAGPGGGVDADSPSLKVVADHIRACAFTVTDGVIPGNEGRGYVLRRITRRAIRHGYKLGARRPFFHRLVADLAAEMGDAYPELRRDGARATEVLRQEEERFFQTIANGMEMLEGALSAVAKSPHLQRAAPLASGARSAGSPHAARNPGLAPGPLPRAGEGGRLAGEGGGEGGMLAGEVAFRLHDTFGFPLDLTADVARERGIAVDSAGFDRAMARQREQARAAAKFKVAQGLAYSGGDTAFHGYEGLAHAQARVVAVYVDGSSVPVARAGDDAVVVLDHTPFYAESGGQVGDRGELRNPTSRFVVDDTVKIQAAVFGHEGRVVEGEVKVGDGFDARVDAERRARTMRNHSATHLMHKALREVLGSHVQQKGSLVDADKTRFDFTHHAPLDDEQVRAVERLVNAEILDNHATNARTMPIADAQTLGAVMLFGEKYGSDVRVLDIGSSRELCGGTHVERTGDIGLFKITSESGVAAGIRRVEAVTGDNALAYLQSLESTVQRLAGSLKSSPAEAVSRLGQVLEHVRSLEKEIGALKGRLASAQGGDLASRAVDVKGLKVLAARLDGADAKTLRDTLDKLKDKLKTAVIVLAAVDGASKVQLAAGVTADSTGRVKAGDVVSFVASQVGGKGGGKADLAMAGGSDPSRLEGALASVAGWVEEHA